MSISSYTHRYFYVVSHSSDILFFMVNYPVILLFPIGNNKKQDKLTFDWKDSIYLIITEKKDKQDIRETFRVERKTPLYGGVLL